MRFFPISPDFIGMNREQNDRKGEVLPQNDVKRRAGNGFPKNLRFFGKSDRKELLNGLITLEINQGS